MKKSTFHLQTFSKPFCHLVLIMCVFKHCNLPNCCSRCCHKEVVNCRRRAIFKTTFCYLVVTFAHGQKCCSSPVCHRVGTESCCDVVLKVLEGENCSSSPVCHLVVTDSVTNVICVTTKWQSDEGANFSPSDTFKTRSQNLVVTLFWMCQEVKIPLLHQSAT